MSKPLYERLLGEDWSKLPEAVRQVHFQGTPLICRGQFQVEQSRLWLARVLAWVVGMPPASAATDVTLRVTGDEQRECWHRTFGSTPMVTWQFAGPGNMLVETMGPWRFDFELRGSSAGLELVHRRSAFGIGWLRIPVPRVLAPRVCAGEFALDDPGACCVEVTVALPLIGQVIAYRGRLERDAEAG